MNRRSNSLTACIITVLTSALLISASSACSVPTNDIVRGPSSIVTVTVPPPRSWSDLLQRTPYTYAIPLPPPRTSVLDGIYCKIDPKQATPVPCKRCPDYAPEGGLWILGLDEGVFRLWYEFTGWRSLGSFILSEDRRSSGPSNRLVLFNDPVCPETVGIYKWTLENETLVLTSVDDPCAIELRDMNLTKQPWRPCLPPRSEPPVPHTLQQQPP